MKYKYNGNWVDLSIKALDSMPLGSIILFAGTDIPTGWMLCDGTSLSEEEYPELFDKIGYTYGGSGTSFNLPNFKGRVGVGKDTTQSYCDNLGDTGGSIELQEHSHILGKSAGAGTSTDWAYIVQNIQNAGSVSTENTGTGNSGNLQPYIVVNYIIKVSNTTPTMASVVNTTNNSTTDAYSCDYSNKHYGGVVLYSGNTSSNITLSDSASNYSYIEVFGQKSGCYGYVKIYSPNGKQFGLAIHNTYESNNIQQMFGRYTISGTTITKDFEVYMNNNGSPTISNEIRIEKVIGYK